MVDARKIGRNLGKHLSDCTSMMIPGMPIFSAYENLIVGMSDEVSINTRLWMTGLSYAGFGSVVSRGRDLSKKLLGITAESSEKVQKIHDLIYFSSINIPFSIGVYYCLSGERDWSKIVIGTGFSCGFGALLGPLSGYAIDACRDMVGLDECHRPAYAKSIKKLSPNVKKGLVALSVAASIVLTAGGYKLSPDKDTKQYQNNNSALEIRIEEKAN